MKILIVGNGGREHALLETLRVDAPGSEFFLTRPNGGMVDVVAVDLAPADVDGIAGWASGAGVDLVVVGPEGPLAGGLVNRLAERGIPAFGPSAAAARIESSKAFAKDLMDEAGVPTAAYRSFTAFEPAARWIREQGAPIVVKASGLAAGKGAVVCETVPEALEALEGMLRGDAVGEAGREVVIESFMAGEELSVLALCDGTDARILPPAQDHKRIGEGDTGPNTGGMGAYAPVSLTSPELLEEVRERILIPVLERLRARGTPFRGVLYAGLMLTTEGPKVVEFNCRFGDPETQVILPLLEGPLLEPIRAVAEGGRLDGWTPRARAGAALTTILAAPGYPGPIRTGAVIDIPDDLRARTDLRIFHAGTTRADGTLRTAGGRVLAVTGLGGTLAEASAASLEGARAISFEGKQFRSDIGWRERDRDEFARP